MTILYYNALWFVHQEHDYKKINIKKQKLQHSLEKEKKQDECPNKVVTPATSLQKQLVRYELSPKTVAKALKQCKETKNNNGNDGIF